MASRGFVAVALLLALGAFAVLTGMASALDVWSLGIPKATPVQHSDYTPYDAGGYLLCTPHREGRPDSCMVLPQGAVLLIPDPEPTPPNQRKS